jgi:hypothetical protein
MYIYLHEEYDEYISSKIEEYIQNTSAWSIVYLSKYLVRSRPRRRGGQLGDQGRQIVTSPRALFSKSTIKLGS